MVYISYRSEHLEILLIMGCYKWYQSWPTYGPCGLEDTLAWADHGRTKNMDPSPTRMSGFKREEYVRIRASVYLAPHQVFIKKILDTYTGSRNPKKNFGLAILDEILDCYRNHTWST